MNISNPIPRTGPNSLTGFDEYTSAAPPALGYGGSDGGGANAYGRPARATPQATAASSSSAWYEQEKPRSLYPRPQMGTQAPYAPPEVVRLDSTAFVPAEASDDEHEIEEDIGNPPPSYGHEDTASNVPTRTYPYSGYATPTANTDSRRTVVQQQQQPASFRPDRPRHEYEDESELYTSPFDSDPEDAVPIAPQSAGSTSNLKPGTATMPKSRWNLRLQLHNAQSMPSLPTGAAASGAGHYPRNAYATANAVQVQDQQQQSTPTNRPPHPLSEAAPYPYPAAGAGQGQGRAQRQRRHRRLQTRVQLPACEAALAHRGAGLLLPHRGDPLSRLALGVVAFWGRGRWEATEWECGGGEFGWGGRAVLGGGGGNGGGIKEKGSDAGEKESLKTRTARYARGPAGLWAPPVEIIRSA
ncbi:hypothetical protein BDZ97DRAFT_1430326 [Flammula alnicola]|nr:hypothetical protein BDZ97DRAFT_1430326 [Flammula alnicola]